ncbi:hypothetical protein HDU77_004440, partial [Chytriomyces hyalinus]
AVQTSNQSAVRTERPTVYTPPQSILVLVHDIPTGTLTVSVCESIVAMPTIIAKSSSAIRSLFSHCKVSENRLIYITAGLMFTPAAPTPFGGSKTRPGYTEYIGTTVASLLLYLVESSFKRYWTCRGREALDFLVCCANKARQLHFAGDADVLNELMLKGIKKAGHIAWNKPVKIPEALRHRQEVQSDVAGSEVLFTPRLSRIRYAFNQ